MKKYLSKKKQEILTIYIFFSDCLRYMKYSGVASRAQSTAKYQLEKDLHKIEKGMSLKEPKLNFGLGIVENILKYAQSDFATNIDIQRIQSLVGRYLKEFCDDEAQVYIKDRYSTINNIFSKEESGYKILAENEINSKITPDELSVFFNSRFSIRNFGEGVICRNVIDQAILSAGKTPSVCNRQAWGVVCIEDKEIIQAILLLQSGNKGFGHLADKLILVYGNLAGFLSPAERNQLWFDTGLYSMSLIYALHSQNVATCPLNWCQFDKQSKKLRNILGLDANTEPSMLLAVGHYKSENKVAISRRMDIEEYRKWI